MIAPLKDIRELVKQLGPRRTWLVGSRALAMQLKKAPRDGADYDLLVEGNDNLSDVLGRANWEDEGYTYLGAHAGQSNGQEVQVWSDNVDEYVAKVPWPCLRLAVNAATGERRIHASAHADLRLRLVSRSRDYSRDPNPSFREQRLMDWTGFSWGGVIGAQAIRGLHPQWVVVDDPEPNIQRPRDTLVTTLGVLEAYRDTQAAERVPAHQTPTIAGAVERLIREEVGAMVEQNLIEGLNFWEEVLRTDNGRLRTAV